jgi:hypothetical protein
MAIAFSCPECSKAYKVKDELAGKSVTCKQCKAAIRVPMAAPVAAAPSPEVESLAVDVLVESKSHAVEAPPEEIEFECPICVETIKLDAKHAGKQAPCPSCGRIVRVPQLADPKARNWRAADHRPAAAKREEDPSLAGAWGNVSKVIVSRDALVEADAIKKKRIKPSVVSKTQWIVIGTLAALALVLGALLFRSHRSTKHRDDFLKAAFAAAGEGTNSTAVSAELCRAAGEFQTRNQPANYTEANKHLREAHDKFGVGDLSAPDKAMERLLVLTEIALSQSRLGGDEPQRSDEDKIAWDKLQSDLRRTLGVLVRGPPQPDGIALAYERLTKSLRLEGGKSPVILGLLGSNVFPNAEHRVEPMAAVGLELLSLGEAGKAKAGELADQARMLLGTGGPQAKLIALHVALDKMNQLPQVKPPAAGEPPAPVRFGFVEGLARRGDIEGSRNIAQLPGRFEDRFAAQALMASVMEPSAANPELAAAVSQLINDLGSRDLPDWDLIRLAQALGRAGPSKSAQDLFDFLQKMSSLSPRSQSIRAWVQYELLRGGAVPISEATVAAMDPQHTAGAALAWEALGRHLGQTGDAPATVANCSPAIRSKPLALAGIALGMLDH